MIDALSSPDFGIELSEEHLTDINFTDDIVLLDPDYETMQCMTGRLQECLGK